MNILCIRLHPRFPCINLVTLFPIMAYKEPRCKVQNITRHRMYFPFFFKSDVLARLQLYLFLKHKTQLSNSESPEEESIMCI